MREPRPTPHRRSALMLCTVSLAAAPWMLPAGCGDAPPPTRVEQPPVEVSLAPVARRSAQRTIEATGTLFGEEQTTISAKLSGRIVTVSADIGDQVEPGAALAQIETRDYELALAERRAAVAASLARVGLTALPDDTFDATTVPTVARAQAEAANANARFDRARQLYEQTPPEISAQEFADLKTSWEVADAGARAALLTAHAELAEARTLDAEASVAAQRLADTTIRAPGAPGDKALRYRVSGRLVSVGEYVSPGRETFRLVATDLIKFRARVPERDSGRVMPGQSVAVRVEAFAEPVIGAVSRVSPVIDAASRTFEVEINIPNADGRLKPGAFARGAIAANIDENVAFVPASSLVTFAGVHKVFSIRDGKAVEHRLQLGARDGEWIEVVGPFDTDAVVVTNANKLASGSAVREVSAP
jgi:RND family efflux transporter MFP subunit